MQSIRLIDFCEEDEKTYYRPQKYNQINCNRIGRPISCGGYKMFIRLLYLQARWKMLQNLINQLPLNIAAKRTKFWRGTDN